MNISNQKIYQKEQIEQYFNEILTVIAFNQQSTNQSNQALIDSVTKSLDSIDEQILGLVSSIKLFNKEIGQQKPEKINYNHETKMQEQDAKQQQIIQKDPKNIPEDNQKILSQVQNQNEQILEKKIQQNQIFSSLMNPLFSLKNNYQSLSKNVQKSLVYRIEFDGCSKGNPGLAGVGFLIKQHESVNQVLERFAVNVGTRTNNQSEYLALIYGLYVAFKVGIQKLFIQGDSQLVIYQMIGKYKVKNENLKNYYDLCKLLQSQFQETNFNHVYREANTEADHLSNVAINK